MRVLRLRPATSCNPALLNTPKPGEWHAPSWSILARDMAPDFEYEQADCESRRRNVIQLYGTPWATVQFDVKVVSLLGAKSDRTTTNLPVNTELASYAIKQCIKHLDSVARHATSARPLSTSISKPHIFQTGEFMTKETADEVQSWYWVSHCIIQAWLGYQPWFFLAGQSQSPDILAAQVDGLLLAAPATAP